MPNPIKYSTGSETLTLKKGNFYIGTGDVSKGPTESTGYYNGITPPTSGYTIYLNKASQGPSIYVASTDNDLITITNQISGQNYTGVTQCLTYFAGQTDKMVLNSDYPSIITNGLIMNLDASFIPSYPKSGSTWVDTSLNGNSATLVNGATYITNSGVPCISLDGTDDKITITNRNLSGFTYNIQYDLDWTIEVWMYEYTFDASPQTYKHIYGNYNGCNYTALKGNAGGLIIYNSTNQSNIYLNLGFGPRNVSPGSQCPTPDVNWSDSDVKTYLWGLQNRWAHFVITSSDGTTYKLYGDGVQKGTTKTVDFKNSSSRTDNVLTSTSQYAWGNAAGNNNAANQVDFNVCRIYNRALTADEVLQNYNAQKSRFGL